MLAPVLWMFYVSDIQWLNVLHSLTAQLCWSHSLFSGHKSLENPFTTKHCINVVNVFSRTCKLAHFQPECRLYSECPLAYYEYLSMTDGKINLVKYEWKYWPSYKLSWDLFYRKMNVLYNFKHSNTLFCPICFPNYIFVKLQEVVKAQQKTLCIFQWLRFCS